MASSDHPLRSGAALLLAALLASAGRAEERAGPPTPVVVTPLRELLVERAFTAPAEVLPANRSLLAAELAAVVAMVHVDVGMAVARGDVLVTLDDVDFRLALARAEAALAAADARVRLAEERVDRAESLAGGDFVSADDLVARRTERDVFVAERATAEVALAEARQALARTTIEAPFAGTVTQRFAQVGNFVVPGTALVTVVETGRLEIEAEVAPEYAASLAAAPRIVLDAGRAVVRARLRRLSPVIEPQTRIQRARLAFVDETLAAGTTGTLRWIGARGHLPPGFVLQRGGRFGVFVVEGGVARFVPLPAAQEGRPAAIDLPDGTLIVTGGADALHDGDPVAPVPR